MRIAVCIEENPEDDRLLVCMKKLYEKLMPGIEVCRYHDKKAFLKELRYRSFDLAYMNVSGGIQDACDTILKIRSINKSVPVFYATGYWRYVERLCDIDPVVVIRKPYAETVFRSISAVKKADSLTEDCFFEYFFKKRIYKIRINEILYFESNGRNIVIHTNAGRQERFLGRLDAVERKLREDGQFFVRCHQSYLIRCRAIRQYGSDRLLLKNNEVLPVSQKRKDGFFDVISQIS